MSGATPQHVSAGSAHAQMEFYQPRFWGLDPLFSAKAKLNISDVLSLQEYPDFPGVYCILNHPIVSVHIVGDVVSICRKNLLIAYEVDDASGVIHCCQWRKTEGSDHGLFIPRLGQLVSVYGKMSEYRGDRQIRVFSIVPEEDPNAEPLHWLEVAHLKKTVYAKPFTLPPGVSSSSTTHLDMQQQGLKEAITEGLIQYLQAKRVPFTLNDLKSDGELKRVCLDRVRTNCDPSKWTEVQFEEDLNRVITNLPQGGYIVPIIVPHFEMQQCIYELLSDEKHLFPVILRYMRDKLETPSAAKFGVPEDWIAQFVEQRPMFSQLPNARIRAAIQHLSDSSQIFPVGPKAYKCVT